jgi:hypothetical protein
MGVARGDEAEGQNKRATGLGSVEDPVEWKSGRDIEKRLRRWNQGASDWCQYNSVVVASETRPLAYAKVELSRVQVAILRLQPDKNVAIVQK